MLIIVHSYTINTYKCKNRYRYR